MGPAKETAEEQLLHMIEGPSGPQSPSRRPMRTSPIGRTLGRLHGWADAVRQGTFFARRTPRDRSDLFLWRLQLVNRVFWVVLLGLGGYLLFELTMLRPQLPAMTPGAITEGEPAPGLAVPGEVGKPKRSLEAYQRTLREHNPFQLASQPAGAPVIGSPQRATPQQILNRKMSNLLVVGISQGAVPEALIEDAKANRTHFVSVGDTVGELKIEAIDRQGVLVSYDGESAYLP